MKRSKLFNTEIETSIRLLTLISQIDGFTDLQKLIYMDFLTLHYGNIDTKSVSLHPANPYHVTEVFSRRELIKSSIDLLLKKGLINLQLNENGIGYSRNNLSICFLQMFESEYYYDLKKNVKLVVDSFGDISTVDFKKYFDENIHKWEDDFKYEIAFRGGDANE